MNSPSFVITFLVVAAIFITRTYFKSFWDTIQPPFMVVIGILSVIVVFVMLYAAYTMLYNSIYSKGEKILYCVLIAGLISFFAWLNVSIWKKWKNENRHRK